MRHFDLTYDFDAISAWYLARGLPVIPATSYPLHGFVEPNIAAGFLYLTDSDIGLVEGLISNPAASKIAAARALDQILNGLVGLATKLRVKRLLGFSKLDSTRRLSERHGFKHSSYYAMQTKELE